jgi:hypothetical protein
MQDKQCLLGRVVDSQVILGESGQVVQHVWETLPQRFPTVVLDAFRLMPNHLHGIFVIPGAGLELSLALTTGAPVVQPGPRAMGTASRTPTPSMGEVVGAFKSIFTIAVKSIAWRLAREGACCKRISSNTSSAVWMSWRRFATTFGKIRCDGVKILKTRIDRLGIGLRPSGVGCRGRACPTLFQVA